MYQNHVPTLQAEALAGPYKFLGLGAFVLLTIRQPLRDTPRTVRHVARHGHDSKYLFSHKRAGFTYFRDHAAELRDVAEACVATLDAERAVTAFAQIPCLGLAKAGFLAQCIGLPVGCLDSHNLVRFDLDYENAVRHRKAWSPALRAKRIGAYLDLCDQLGGAETLWDTWCAYVAGRQPDLFTYSDPFAVSAIHVTAFRQWHN